MPLTIKMVYNQQFYTINEDKGFNYGPKFINDSTTVVYKWDNITKTLQGQYAASKINGPQILTYYVNDNHLLFINAYYGTLKKLLLSKQRKKWVLNFLNQVKNHETGNKTTER